MKIREPGRLLIPLSYLTLYLVWGATYYASRVAMRGLSAFDVIWMRYLAGGIVCLLLLAFRRPAREETAPGRIAGSAILGILLLVFGTGMVTWGMMTVDSYLAALMVASMPLAVSLFDRIFNAKRIPLSGVIGILCGIAGVGLLLYDGRLLPQKIDPGVLKVLTGVLSWGFATSMSSRMKPSKNVLVNSAVQMFAASLPLLLILTLVRGPAGLVAGLRTPAVTGAVIFLAAGGTLALFAFNYLLKKEPAIRVVSYVFVNPLVAMLLGIVIGNEKPARLLLPGAGLIFCGLLLLLYAPRIFSKKPCA